MRKKELSYEDKRKIVEKNFNDLIESSPHLRDPADLAQIKKAFKLADDAHKDQFRRTGKKLPYIVHPIAVAKIISSEMGFGKTTVTAALLHDVVEDSDGKYTIEDIKKEFGGDVAQIVDGVTKIMEGFDPNSTIQVETFKKFINNMSKDKRTAFVKIADRLHNLRTFAGIRENSQMIKTAEAYDIYAPLAHLLGLYEIKKEIEDLSFQFRSPVEYKKTKNKADNSNKTRLKFYNAISEKIHNNFPKNKFKFSVEISQRSLYRAWRITKTKKIGFNEIHNFNSLRIVLKPMKTYSEKQQCYSAYAYLTDLFTVRQLSFKDWVTNPKSNGFQALIIDVMHDGKWAEVQIMTERMNEVARKGYAPGYENKHTENVYRWVNSIKEILNNKDLTRKEIYELVRPQHREIYTLSPKGDIVKLPKLSTVLDYAFQIHTDLGIHFKAAEVNGKIVNHNYVLDNADQVNIFYSENIQPQTEWIDSLTSHRNKNILRQYFRKQKRKIIKQGEMIYYRLSKRLNIADNKLSTIINKFNCDNRDEFFFRVGNRTITETDISGSLKRRRMFGRVWHSSSSDKLEVPDIKAFNSKEIYLIKDFKNISLAKCCRPVEGDPVIIYRIDKSNYILHRNDCPQAKNLNSSDGKNTAKAVWLLTESRKFRSTIQFNGVDNKGLLSEMIDIISKDHDINMTSLRINVDKSTFKGKIDIMVNNIESLDSVLKKIRKIKYIKQAYRVSEEI